MAQTGAFMVLVAVKDIDTETVVISLPYLFNPSQFYCSKIFYKTPLSGYYEYNTITTQNFIDIYDDVCQNLLRIVDEHYSITFSCDSNTLHFTFRVVLSPHNSPKMCAHVLHYIISTGLATHGAPRIVFYDNLARQYTDLPEIKFAVSTISVDARLMNLQAKSIKTFDTVQDAPYILTCESYPEVFAKELASKYKINSYIGGRDHLLIDNADLERFNEIRLGDFNTSVSALIDQLQTTGDILKYVKYGAVVIDTPATSETILNADNFEVKKKPAAHGGDGDSDDDSDDAGDNEGRRLDDGAIMEVNSHYLKEDILGGKRNKHKGNKHNLSNRDFHKRDKHGDRVIKPSNYSSNSGNNEDGADIPIAKPGKHNSCNVDVKPGYKDNGDRGSIRNKEGPLIHHVDEGSSIYREVELPVSPANFDFAPNPETLRIFLDYIDMSKADYDKLDKEEQLDVLRKFVRKNPHTYQVFSNKGIYTLYEAPGRIDRILHDDAPVAVYRRRECEVKSSNHWGQRKLLISEIEFLNMYAHKSDNLLYIGAAPGDHILLLMKMFPHMTIHMYDSQPYAMRPNLQFVQFHEYFTDAHAARYADDGKEWLIICDMRAFSKFDNKKSEISNESVVAEDMVDQEKWVYTIKPVASLLKFRLGWDDKKTRYMGGQIYIQLWQGESSTEARLLSERQPDGNMPPRRLYGNRIYEEQCYKHNVETRVGIFKPFNSNVIEHIDVIDTTLTIADTELIGIGITAKPAATSNPTTSTSGGDKHQKDSEEDVDFGPYYCCCYDCVGEIEILGAYLATTFSARVIHNLLRKPGEPLIESALFIEALVARQSEAPASQTQFLTKLITSPDWSDARYAAVVAFFYEDSASLETPTVLLSSLKSAIKRKPESKRVDELLDAATTTVSLNAGDFTKLLSLMAAVATQIRTAPQVKSPEIAAIDFKTANPASRDIILKLGARISYFLNMFISKTNRRLNATEFGSSDMPNFTTAMIKQLYVV